MNWNQVFSPDNLFFRIIARGVDLVGLSLCWAMLCLPVVTIGPATAALYCTVVKTFRQGESAAFSLFFRSFRDNLRQGVPVTLICLAVGIPLFYGYLIMLSAAAEDSVAAVMYMAYYVALVIPIGVLCYLLPLMGRFQFTTKDLFRSAFAMSIRHLPSTVIIVLLVVQLAGFTLRVWAGLFFTPVIAALLVSLFLERIFPKYLSTEETAKLRNMTVDELLEEERAEQARREKKRKQ